MQPALLFSLLGSLFFVSAIVVTIAAFRRAPEGYEDESGFHAIARSSATGVQGALQASLSHS
jgi:hypothetical protein